VPDDKIDGLIDTFSDLKKYLADIDA